MIRDFLTNSSITCIIHPFMSVVFNKYISLCVHPQVSHQVDSTETRDALVVTLENTIISACNSGSLVCKARFKGFCMRFAPEFETSLDDWKPDFKDHINLCTVSEGTYEVCSRTVARHSEKVECCMGKEGKGEG